MTAFERSNPRVFQHFLSIVREIRVLDSVSSARIYSRHTCKSVYNRWIHYIDYLLVFELENELFRVLAARSKVKVFIP